MNSHCVWDRNNAVSMRRRCRGRCRWRLSNRHSWNYQGFLTFEEEVRWNVQSRNVRRSLGLMVLSMLCWGSWANAFSLARGRYRFELFYWDYAVGIMLGVLILAAVRPQSAVFYGTMDAGKAAWASLRHGLQHRHRVARRGHQPAGMAVAFPVCVGLAMLIGGGVSCASNLPCPRRRGAGLGLILASVLLDAAAYRARSRVRRSPRPATS